MTKRKNKIPASVPLEKPVSFFPYVYIGGIVMAIILAGAVLVSR